MRALLWLGLVLLLLGGRPRRRPSGEPPLRLVLILLLVGLRSGQSVLSALQSASRALPHHRELSLVTRMATVAGLGEAMDRVRGPLRPVMAQLARGQRSGAPLAGIVARMIEDDLAVERAAGLAKAKKLPTRLLVPVTLLMLPGLVLLLYAPSLIALYDELTGVWP
ncbi:MAG: hypothetical protein L0Z63_00990 [Actinobacteria bacterium]|nr:hypothetical protein [Actinomycetota bacterium]